MSRPDRRPGRIGSSGDRPEQQGGLVGLQDLATATLGAPGSALHNGDHNNFAPRLGFAYSPLDSGHVVLRAGYGLFYSRSTFQYVSSSVIVPPTYVLGRQPNPPSLADPFFSVPRPDQFPTFVPTIPLSGSVLDRNILTPYFHQYNISVQREWTTNMLLEAAYVARDKFGYPVFYVIRNHGFAAAPGH